MRLLISAALSGCFCFVTPTAFASAITEGQKPIADRNADGSTAIAVGSALSARGVLRAGEMADIAAGMSGRLLKAGFKPGSAFKKGDVLAKFDCKRQSAQLEALNRAYETLSLRYENTRELFTAGAAGELELNIAQSEMQQSAAERDALKASTKDCVVYAPYSGHVIARHVSAFETPQAGAPLYSIIRSGSLEISVIAPSNWMRWLKSGQVFAFTVDETGEQFSGKVVRTGAAVDPVSQTIEITAKPTGKAGSALAGMSGVAIFSPHPKQVVPRGSRP